MKWCPHVGRKSSKVRAVEWEISLGMHLFRQAERETLRVRPVISARCTVRGNLPNRKKSNVKNSSSKTMQSFKEALPLACPRRGAQRRRVRKVTLRARSRGSKNPVKVVEIPKEKIRSSIEVKCRTVVSESDFIWDKTKRKYARYDTRDEEPPPFDVYDHPRSGWPVAGCQGNGHFHHKQCLWRPKHVFLTDDRKSFTTIWDVRCPISRKDWRSWLQEVGSSKEKYVRHGATRDEKRRNWFADKVVKNVSRVVDPNVLKIKASRLAFLHSKGHVRLFGHKHRRSKGSETQNLDYLIYLGGVPQRRWTKMGMMAETVNVDGAMVTSSGLSRMFYAMREAAELRSAAAYKKSMIGYHRGESYSRFYVGRVHKRGSGTSVRIR